MAKDLVDVPAGQTWTGPFADVRPGDYVKASDHGHSLVVRKAGRTLFFEGGGTETAYADERPIYRPKFPDTVLGLLTSLLQQRGLDAQVIGTGGTCDALEVRKPGAESHVLITDGDASAPFAFARWSAVTESAKEPGTYDVLAMGYTHDGADDGNVITDWCEVEATGTVLTDLCRRVAAALD